MMDSGRQRLVYVRGLPAEIDDGQHKGGEKDVNGLEPVVAIVKEKHPEPISLSGKFCDEIRKKVIFETTQRLIHRTDGHVLAVH